MARMSRYLDAEHAIELIQEGLLHTARKVMVNKETTVAQDPTLVTPYTLPCSPIYSHIECAGCPLIRFPTSLTPNTLSFPPTHSFTQGYGAHGALS